MEYYLLIANLLMFIWLVYGIHKVYKFQEQYRQLINDMEIKLKRKEVVQKFAESLKEKSPKK